MIFKEKRHVMLLELLIALAITAILLSTLLFFYRQITLSNGEWEKKESKEFSLRYVEERLTRVLSNSATQKGNKKKSIVFHSLEDLEGVSWHGTAALIFCFDNGITRDKELSNETLALLFVDKHQQLTLALWPAPSRWENGAVPPMEQREILLSGVDGLDFSFFSANAVELGKPTDASSTEEKPPKLGPTWQRKWKMLPHIVYITLTKNDANKSKIRLAIPIPQAQPHITYND